MDRPATKSGGYIWNLQAETMPRTELIALQTRHLQQQVARAYERVPFYRQALEDLNRAAEHKRIGRRDECVGRHDDFIAGLQVQ